MNREILAENIAQNLSFSETHIQNLNSGMLSRFLKTFPADSIYLEIKNAQEKIVAAGIFSFNTEKFFPTKNKILFIHEIWEEENNKGYLPVLLYLIMRRGRIEQKQHVITRNDNASCCSILRMKNLSSDLAIQTLDYAIHLAYQNCHNDNLVFVKKFFGDEVVETVKNWLQDFFNNNSWVQTILQGKITRQQYIASLFNIHTYVRYTTRLCARCIAYCDNPELRDHYINHLRGEINHERIIERDLKYLGEDVDYLMNYYLPNTETKQFMMTQESTIAFYRDPILMLACPLAAEGITAAITDEFMDALYNSIASWGVKEPKEAARFIYSHRNTDGGEDGHWIRVVNMIQRFVKDEYQLRKFLSILNSATEGLSRSFASNIEQNEFSIHA